MSEEFYNNIKDKVKSGRSKFINTMFLNVLKSQFCLKTINFILTATFMQFLYDFSCKPYLEHCFAFILLWGFFNLFTIFFIYDFIKMVYGELNLQRKSYFEDGGICTFVLGLLVLIVDIMVGLKLKPFIIFVTVIFYLFHCNQLYKFLSKKY